MNKIRLCVKVVFLAVGLGIIASYPICAQEELAGKLNEGSVEAECLRDGDISKIDFGEQKVISNVPLLSECVQCRAAARNDIGECNYLRSQPEYFNACQRYFNDYSGPTMQFLVSGDISLCAKAPIDKQAECRKMVTGGGASLCKDNSCLDKVSYVEAIKFRNIKNCGKIKNNLIRAMCQGYISKDEKICAKGKGFEDFKNRYCGLR